MGAEGKSTGEGSEARKSELTRYKNARQESSGREHTNRVENVYNMGTLKKRSIHLSVSVC